MTVIGYPLPNLEEFGGNLDSNESASPESDTGGRALFLEFTRKDQVNVMAIERV